MSETNNRHPYPNNLSSDTKFSLNDIREILVSSNQKADEKTVLMTKEILDTMWYTLRQLEDLRKQKDMIYPETSQVNGAFHTGSGRIPQDASNIIKRLSKQKELIEGGDLKKFTPEVRTKKYVVSKKPTKIDEFLEKNRSWLRDVGSMLFYRAYYRQTLENIRGIIKPEDDLHHGKNGKTAILIPGFLCNQWVMKNLGNKLSNSMNVVYPDISVTDYSHKSLAQLADKIVSYIKNLERQGKLPEDWEYTIIWHSLGWAIAVLVSCKLRTDNIIQIATPNQTPPVAHISWLNAIPAVFDLREISQIYERAEKHGLIENLTAVIPRNDAFVWTDVQWSSWIPRAIPVRKAQNVYVNWGHIDPIFNDEWIQAVVNAANTNQTVAK